MGRHRLVPRLPIALQLLAATALAALLVAPALAQPDDAERTRARISELEADIAQLTRARRDAEQQRGTLQTSLRETEEALAALRRDQRATEAAAATNREAIADLDGRQQQLRASAAAQQEAVRREVRNAYRDGGNDQLKLLLGEDDPQELARMLAYYRYVLGARRALIGDYRATLASLDAVATELAGRRQQLEAQLAQLRDQGLSLESLRAERQQLLAQIEARLSSQAEDIAAREAEREELEMLLEEIEAAVAQLMPEEGVEAFTVARGRMPWPVAGRITDSFGRPRAQGKLRWQGVRMRADAGSTVSAIHHGRVVYADWLRGSGLLLVIDHGEGYMSLYAHNESLLREVGDWVSTGSPVATVGDTGGQSEAALYFEIRKDGKPTDPALWCRG